MKLRVGAVVVTAALLMGAIGALAYHSADLLAGSFMQKWPLL